MKAAATNIEELFSAAGENEELMRELDRIISATAPEMERRFFEAKSISMISYGELPYHTKDYKTWPVISLAPQKNSVNIYISALKEGKELTFYYQNKLGKVSMGKSCIRVPKLEKLEVKALKNMICDAVEWYLSQKEKKA